MPARNRWQADDRTAALSIKRLGCADRSPDDTMIVLKRNTAPGSGAVRKWIAARSWQAWDQWNCSSSVEPVSAVTEDAPPWITVVTSSK